MSIEPIPGRCGSKLVPKCPDCLNEYGKPLGTWQEVCPGCNKPPLPSEYCEKYPLKNKQRCEMHGGRTPVGEESIHFKHGRYSKQLPLRLIDNYFLSINDPDTLVLRDEIALIESRINDLIVRVDTGESGQVWTKLDETFDAFKEARAAKDADGMMKYLEEMHKTIKRGKSDYMAWQEIVKLIDQRRRLVESERRRLVEAQQVISYSEVMTLLASIESIIRDHVQDQIIIKQIGTNIRQLLNS